MKRRSWRIIQVLAGVGAMGALGAIGLWLSPRSTPPAPAAGPVSSSPRTNSSSSRTKPAVAPKVAAAGPFGFRPISYTGWNSQLAHEAHASKIILLAPKEGPVGTTVDETYRGPGSVITIWYNDMIVLESPHSMTPYYQPISSTPFTANGLAAVWDEVASEGGPLYRLLFHEDGTYVRLQLLSPLPDTVSEATDIASLFKPLGAGPGAA